jgi:hypothetical protein
LAESEASITANEEMQVVRHNHISADRNIELRYCLRAVSHKSLLGDSQRGDFTAMKRAYRDEEQWRVVGLKNLR